MLNDLRTTECSILAVMVLQLHPRSICCESTVSIRKSWGAPEKDELTTCVTEHHSALVHRLWQLSGQGDHLRLVLLTEHRFTRPERQTLLLTLLFEDLTAGEVVCIIPLILFT